jgi:hypothetical protein
VTSGTIFARQNLYVRNRPKPELRDYRAFLREADFIVATPSDDENEDVCASGFGFSAFGFLFSRLPLCSRFAMAVLLGVACPR